MDQKVTFKTPSITVNGDGSLRRVGFELEFSGLALDETINTVQSSLGGNLIDTNPAEQLIHVDSMGDFNVEIDWDFLKRTAKVNNQNEDDSKWIQQLSIVASALVPVEVVCPPIPITSLNLLDPMVSRLRRAGAVGTEESLIATYGVHINTEIPNLDAETFFAYLRSFSLLQWWLVEAHHVNTSRKISPYIDLYPENYVKLLASQTSPCMDKIFEDYLEYNASRNRALDLLPILADIDKPRVFDKVNDPKIKSRPAFHYRLPNCNIEHNEWSLAQSWNIWWVVEQLAQRRDDIKVLSGAFLDAGHPIIGVTRNKWVKYLDKCLKDHELV